MGVSLQGSVLDMVSGLLGRKNDRGEANIPSNSDNKQHKFSFNINAEYSAGPSNVSSGGGGRGRMENEHDMLVVLLPILIVLTTIMVLLTIFLVTAVILKRRRGIELSDGDGPVDLGRDEFAEGAGGFSGVEQRWLEGVDDIQQRSYQQAKDYQAHHPPNSLPTDITLSQFLSIQEKGVSAWSFEPDYESQPSVLVHARTELTFLPDPESPATVQSNLPLPKLNEVYYWEVKMFDLPPTTNVAIGLGTKPFPPFRFPGHARFSVAYLSNGDRCYNWPFAAASFGPALKEGDVLGIGYRTRTGALFFTRNGRKTEDAFVGLGKWNMFPSIGADGPCSLHVNLGQSGFVHIEANVKKWGLAPSVGTLAPPPAYGSERGSILLESGGNDDNGRRGGGAAGRRIGSRGHHRRRRSSPPALAGSTTGAGPSSYASTRRSGRSRRQDSFTASSSNSTLPAGAMATSMDQGAQSLSPGLIPPSPLRGFSASSPHNQSGSSIPLAGSNLPEPIVEEDVSSITSSPVADTPHAQQPRYMSPTDVAYHDSQRRRGPSLSLSTNTAHSEDDVDDFVVDREDRALLPLAGESEDRANDATTTATHQSNRRRHEHRRQSSRTGAAAALSQPSTRNGHGSGGGSASGGRSRSPASPEQSLNPPTPHVTDISLHDLRRLRAPPAAEDDLLDDHDEGRQSRNADERSPPPSLSTLSPDSQSRSRSGSGSGLSVTVGDTRSPEPPAYTIVDPARYPEGLNIEIPEDILAAALNDTVPHQNS